MSSDAVPTTHYAQQAQQIYMLLLRMVAEELRRIGNHHLANAITDADFFAGTHKILNDVADTKRHYVVGALGTPVGGDPDGVLTNKAHREIAQAQHAWRLIDTLMRTRAIIEMLFTVAADKEVDVEECMGIAQLALGRVLECVGVYVVSREFSAEFRERVKAMISSSHPEG